MKKILLIHIGWHKTATTVLQSYLSQFRKKLAKYDICYPIIEVRSNYGKIKHCDYLASILNELNPKGRKFDVRPFNELFQISLEEIGRSKCQWAIISDEGFSFADPRIAKMMAPYKNHFDTVKIIAYVRRQDFFLESFYSQLIKQDVTRIKRPFHIFYTRPHIRKRLDYYATLQWWADEFGAENILVTPYEKHTINPDPVSHFFIKSGLPQGILHRHPPNLSKINTSPSRELTEFFRYLNRQDADFREFVIDEFFSKSSSPLTNARYLSSADRQQVLDDFKDCNQKIAREYLNRENGILFEEPVIEYPNCHETWRGFKQEDVLSYALEMNGQMSIEIDRLRKENQRISNAKKFIYRYFLEFFNKKRISRPLRHRR